MSIRGKVTILITGIGFALMAAGIVIITPHKPTPDEHMPGKTELALQSVDLTIPGTTDIVHVEDIAASDAADIQALFQSYAEADKSTTNPGGIAWVHQQARQVVDQWFDPKFDLIAAYSAISGNTPHSGSTTAWLDAAFDRAISQNNADKGFYYVYDEELGCYRMSAAYFYLGLYYSQRCINT